MKKLILFLVFIGTSIGFSQENSLQWITDFEIAKQVSKDTKKPILMYFTGSDWCS